MAISDHERHRRQRQHRQPGLEDEHRHPGEHDREDRLGDEDQAVAEEEAHRLEVDGGARHQLAGLLAVEEPELEALELPVERVAQVDLDPERDAAGDQSPRRAQPQSQDARGADRDRPHRQLMPGMAAGDRVDRRPGQSRDQDGHTHRAAGERERPPDSPSIRAQETYEPAEDKHFIKYSGVVDLRPRGGAVSEVAFTAGGRSDRERSRARIATGPRS